MSCSASSSLAFATFADGLDPLLNRIDLVFAAITLAILALGHIAFIVIAWVARRFELSKLGKTRDERRRMNKEGSLLNDGDSTVRLPVAALGTGFRSQFNFNECPSGLYRDGAAGPCPPEVRAGYRRGLSVQAPGACGCQRRAATRSRSRHRGTADGAGEPSLGGSGGGDSEAGPAAGPRRARQARHRRR
jgi:hypothetical protein